ncbi:MAG: hypothetical protein AB8U25_03490 [Rickettsiales endosymbiont of Dermacentor nuttalli]
MIFSNAYANEVELYKRIELLEQKIQKLEKLLLDMDNKNDFKNIIDTGNKETDLLATPYTYY